MLLVAHRGPSSWLLIVGTLGCCLMTAEPRAHAADSPFVNQIPPGIALDPMPNPGPVPAGQAVLQHFVAGPMPVSSIAAAASANRGFIATNAATNLNLAATVEIGSQNNVTQLQNGSGDRSNVGIVAGDSNNVGVFQNGNNLQSSVLLIGTKGMSVGVLQPNGSSPVSMAVIHVPAGTVILPR